MLFKQFQDDADIERCKGVPPAAGTSESFMGRRRSSVGGINSVKKLKLRYRLTPRSLLCLLVKKDAVERESGRRWGGEKDDDLSYLLLLRSTVDVAY